MKTLNFLLISSFLISVSLSLFSASTHAATFNILNNCSNTVWAAALPGGGLQMDSGQTWALNTSSGRIWARTNCSFDNPNNGTCLTGDCAGLLQCTSNGTQPKTMAEFSLNQTNNRDSYYISLVDGFNVPMEFGPSSGSCRTIRCSNADIVKECPNGLKRPGGCINPACTRGNCEGTKFFKQRCLDAYTFPGDITFTCRAGTNYRVVFCP